MQNAGGIFQLIAYLGAMIIVVPISKRLGLGTVLGYLIAGILLGPHGLGWIADSQQDALHLAEFGVIMMLLMIGLELNPSVLWTMRGPIFGLGGLQVVLTTAIFCGLGVAFGLGWQPALTTGMILAVSSTAIVLQTMAEKGYANSNPGKKAFAILLFQDIAVIPMLALFPFLAGTLVTQAPASVPLHSGWQQALMVIAAIGVLVGGGRFVVRPVFNIIAKLKLRETFTAMALLMVASTTALMQAVGLSPALGAFLAGVVLADSEYRHQIEADLEPFKGLLLGLFFISIGAGVDLRVPVAQPLAVALAVLALIVFKSLIIYGIASTRKMQRADKLLLSVSLGQGGEFAFVLLALAGENKLLDPEMVQVITAAVAVSMGLAPLLIAAVVRWGLPLMAPPKSAPEQGLIEAKEDHIIVIGIGRFGQVVVRLLQANGFRTTVLDYDAAQIEVMERFGIKTYFGDGTRPELLRSAGIERCKLLVIAIDDQEAALRIAGDAKKEYPQLVVYARAFDRVHAYKLINLGVEHVVIETGGSAIDLGIEILRGLGFTALRAHRQGIIFDKYNRDSIRELAPLFKQTDRNNFLKEARQRIDALAGLLQTESVTGHADGAWEGPLPKDS